MIKSFPMPKKHKTVTLYYTIYYDFAILYFLHRISPDFVLLIRLRPPFFNLQQLKKPAYKVITLCK